MKKLILLLLLLQGTIIFGQVKFENKKLALINDIYYKTTKENIDSFMEKKGFEKGEVEKEVDDNVGEIFTYSSKFDNIEVFYSKDNTIHGITCDYDGAPNNIFIEIELKEKGYSSKVKKEEFEGETTTMNVWSIKGSKLKFLTSSDEKTKSGAIGFGKFDNNKENKDDRNIAFFSLRAGYIMPTNEESQKVTSAPSSILNQNVSSPYESGQFGLKPGFNAGFTGIINLEFINKNLPSWLGIGIPADINFALMQYSWDETSSNYNNNGYKYEDAKYELWGIMSAGAGLSLTFHPAKKLFIDFIGRADYCGTFGGDYKSNATKGTSKYNVKTLRGQGNDADSFCLAKTIGVNIRYKSIMLGFEMKQDIIDEAKFTEYVENSSGSTTNYPLKNPGLNLDNMQFTIGYLF